MSPESGAGAEEETAGDDPQQASSQRLQDLTEVADEGPGHGALVILRPMLTIDHPAPRPGSPNGNNGNETRPWFCTACGAPGYRWRVRFTFVHSGDDLVAKERLGNARYDRQRILASLSGYECEEIDGSRLGDEAREALIKDARSVSMSKHVVVATVFGSNEHPWTEFGTTVPALLVYDLVERAAILCRGSTRTRLLIVAITRSWTT